MFHYIADKLQSLNYRYNLPTQQISYPFRTLGVWWDNICRIIDYAPVLWKDWDFDCTHGVASVVLKKLERMEKSLEYRWSNLNDLDDEAEYKDYCNRERKSKSAYYDTMKRLRRYIEDSYVNDALGEHEEKWGQLVLSHYVNGVCIGIGHEKCETEEDVSLCNEELLQIYDDEYYRKNEDFRIAFENIIKYKDVWWY